MTMGMIVNGLRSCVEVLRDLSSFKGIPAAAVHDPDHRLWRQLKIRIPLENAQYRSFFMITGYFQEKKLMNDTAQNVRVAEAHPYSNR
jgi:hypothetical protein